MINVIGSLCSPLTCLFTCNHDIEKVIVAVRDKNNINILQSKPRSENKDTEFEILYRRYKPDKLGYYNNQDNSLGCRCLSRFSDLRQPIYITRLRKLQLFGADIDDDIIRVLSLTGAASSLQDLSLVHCNNVSTQSLSLLIAGRDVSRYVGIYLTARNERKRTPSGSVLEALSQDKDETVLIGESDLRRVVVFCCRKVGAEVVIPLLMCPSRHLHTVILGLNESLEAQLAEALVQRHRLTRFHVSPDEEGLEAIFQTDHSLIFSSENT